MIYRFEVPFVRGKGRVRFYRRGNGVGTYTDDATAKALYDIRAAFKDAGGTQAPEGTEVSVFIDTLRKLPKSRPKRIEQEPDIYKPDADNIAKLVLDALNGVAWHDDTQVTGLFVHKGQRYRHIQDTTIVSIHWGDDNDDNTTI